jgi:GTP-binding protein EngB required for normal cell division
MVTYNEEHVCDMCKSAIIDDEYFMMIKNEPHTTMVILCTQDKVKDNYYNRNMKKLKKVVRINAENEPPVLIGKAHDYCRGIYFERDEKSVLDNEDDRL